MLMFVNCRVAGEMNSGFRWVLVEEMCDCSSTHGISSIEIVIVYSRK